MESEKISIKIATAADKDQIYELLAENAKETGT